VLYRDRASDEPFSHVEGAGREANGSVSILEVALEVLLSDRQDGYSDASVALLEPRVSEAIERADGAIETGL